MAFTMRTNFEKTNYFASYFSVFLYNWYYSIRTIYFNLEYRTNKYPVCQSFNTIT